MIELLYTRFALGNVSSAKQRVLAAVVRADGLCLVCLRPPHKRHGGLWEFPGGKVEPGETDLEAMRRELREELEVEVLALGREVFAVEDTGSPFLIVFVEAQVSGVPVCREHTELRWGPLTELSSLPFAPSDRRFVDHMLAGQDYKT